MRKLKILTLVSLLCLSLTGCSLHWQKSVTNQEETNLPVTSPGEQEEEHETIKTGSDTLVIAMNTPKTFNPLYNTQRNVEQALYLIFSPLVNVEEDGTISSNLAESWLVNDTQTAVTVTLKSGLTWHDGTPLTSDDVLFTLSQIRKIPDCPYAQTVANIQDAQKIDSTTFKIIYRQSFSGLLATLFFPVIPQHIYDVENSSALTITPIGSGPYQYESATSLESITLKANPNYFNGKPSIEKVQVNFIPDEESSLYAFKQGLIDVVYTDETEWGKYTNHTANTAYEMVSSNYEFIGLNMNKTIFQNASVRSALVYGINREDIIRLYYLDHAVVTDSPISPVSYLKDKTLETKSYDKETAKYLLLQEGYEFDEQAGLMMKNGNAFSFKLLVNEESRERVKIAEELKKMYQEIGVEMKLEEVDKVTYLNRILNKDYDAFLGAYQLSYALDLSFALHSASILSGENSTSYQDQKMDELLQQAFVATGEAAPAAYSELEQYFEEVNPYVSLFFKKSVLITKNNIGGEIHPTPLNIFANIEKWTIA